MTSLSVSCEDMVSGKDSGKDCSRIEADGIPLADLLREATPMHGMCIESAEWNGYCDVFVGRCESFSHGASVLPNTKGCWKSSPELVRDSCGDSWGRKLTVVFGQLDLMLQFSDQGKHCIWCVDICGVVPHTGHWTSLNTVATLSSCLSPWLSSCASSRAKTWP